MINPALSADGAGFTEGGRPELACLREGSEAVDVRDTKDERVNLGGANRGTVQGDIGFDFHPAHVQPHRATITDRIVHTCMKGDAPGIVEFEIPECRRFFKERGVVDVGADKRCSRRIGLDVVVQRQGRGQLFGRSRKSTPKVDVMFKRRGRQQLKPQIVHKEVFDSQSGAGAGINGRGRASKRAVVRFGIHIANPNAKTPVPFGLRNQGSSQTSAVVRARAAVVRFIFLPSLSCMM